MEQENWRILALLNTKELFPKEANIATLQLHGFSDASEMVYAGVVYTDTIIPGSTQLS